MNSFLKFLKTKEMRFTTDYKAKGSMVGINYQIPKTFSLFCPIATPVAAIHFALLRHESFHVVLYVKSFKIKKSIIEFVNSFLKQD
jgi:hypothetical protein